MEVLFVMLVATMTFAIAITTTKNSAETARSFAISEESRLITRLMEHYKPLARPRINSSETVMVMLKLYLTQIDSLNKSKQPQREVIAHCKDEKKQILITTGWITMVWDDDYLRWDPHDYGNVRHIEMPSDKIWIPSFTLDNAAGIQIKEKYSAYVFINHTGTVVWETGGVFAVTCDIDISYYPFDDQTCAFKFASWDMATHKMVMHYDAREAVSMATFIQNGEWDVVETCARNTNYTSDITFLHFPEVHFRIVMRRKYLFYLVNILVPCFLMSALLLLMFCLPADAGEKVSVGLTVLLTFSVFQLMIVENIPTTSESVPIVGIYLTSFMVITTGSIFLSVITLGTYRKGQSGEKMPPWMQRLVFLGIAKLICFNVTKRVKLLRQREFRINLNRSGAAGADDGSSFSGNNRANLDNKSSISLNEVLDPLPGFHQEIASPENSPTTKPRFYNPIGDMEPQQTPTPNGRPMTGIADTVDLDIQLQRRLTNSNYQTRFVRNPPTPEKPPQMNRTLTWSMMLSSAATRLDRLRTNLARPPSYISLDDEQMWHLAAIVLDRFFFMVTLSLMTLSSVGTLLLMPLMKPESVCNDW